ncbi:prolyl-tRNA synthetase [Pyrolobus fumarii 1A]|uniref:Proline--tRNA ligase n=1 Tax=Pyrolobus fumarii (strain DSM 11204 / 1A) TaxID=694429 RepID=G0EDR3_PYRF1|nr:proline--tRNA ligase [Pyrolobus fumarii]AEM38682.1 prolyl-tRNA synthetase [Pyrolobus fumarii 1A]
MAERRRWSEEFPRWFDWVLEAAGIYDWSHYPVKGMGVWLPYGFKIRRLVTDLIRRLLDETGHDEVLFPLLIPEHLMRKEAEHIKGFEAEVYWVTRGGIQELDVKLALRPTSETAITYMESFWIKSYKQLPAKYYQIVSIFRYETKATRPLIRLREVTTFKEAHTAHANFDDSERQVLEAIDVYKRFFDALGIPYLISRRPEWDKFAGAVYTIAFDTIMPDGRALQIGTVHNLGQNFSKAFDVKIQLPDETLDYIWQTSYGLSDRVIATIIAIHGDDRGLVLPPIVAPIQVVVVPIPAKSEEETRKVREYIDSIVEELREKGVRVYVDWRSDVTPGYKFYDWELRGVPVRLEVGPRDVKNRTVVVARRDTLEKKTVPRDQVISEVLHLLDDIGRNMREKAWKWFRSYVHRSESLDEARKLLEEKRGIVEVPWCGREECGKRMEELTDAKVLGSPLQPPEWVRGASCPVCGRPAATSLRLAKRY